MSLERHTVIMTNSISIAASDDNGADNIAVRVSWSQDDVAWEELTEEERYGVTRLLIRVAVQVDRLLDEKRRSPA